MRCCDMCGVEYVAKRPQSRFCSDLCRKRAQRAPQTATAGSERSASLVDGQVTARTEARIAELDLLEDPQAAVALVLARRLDSDAETGAAVASLARQYQVVMDDLGRRGRRSQDPLDALLARRNAKVSGA